MRQHPDHAHAQFCDPLMLDWRVYLDRTDFRPEELMDRALRFLPIHILNLAVPNKFTWFTPPMEVET